MAHEVSGASLSPIYERLNTAPRYHPIEAETFADWTVEAGDIITVTRDGESYQSPVQESVIKWKKGQQVSVSSGGNEKRDAVSKVSQNKYNNGIGGGSGLRNTGYLAWSIERSYNEMRAGLVVTASSVAAYVENKYTQMRSGLVLTASSAHMYVDSKYDQMTSGLKLTASSAHLYVDSKYTQMTSGLKLTASSAHLYVDSKYTQMTSGLKLSESSAHLYVNNRYTQMQSGLKLSESSAHLYVNNRYTQMQSGLKLSESSAHLYVNNRYTQMQSGLKLSESSAHLYVNNRYTQMQSGLKLSESSAHLYVNNRYTQMQSGLKLSESSVHAYVESKYTQMQSGLKLTEDSAVLYARNRTTKAAIIARINGDGRSEALIEADMVSVNGTTTINDVMTIADNRVRITQPLRVMGDAMVETLTIRDGSSSDTITQSDLAGMIKSASVSGNVLTLTPVRGQAITFSKATSLSGTWSGGILTVVASPQSVSATVTISVKGSNASGNPYTVSAVSTNRKLGTASIIAQATSSIADNASISGTVQLDCTQNWNDGYNTGSAKAKVSGPISIVSNGTYLYKGVYEDLNGDDQESGHNVSVTVEVPDASNITIGNFVFTQPSGASDATANQGFQITATNGVNSVSNTIYVKLTESDSWSSSHTKNALLRVTDATFAGNSTVIAKYSIDASSVYNDAWAAARSAVTWPAQGNTTSNTFTVLRPASTVGSTDTHTYGVWMNVKDDTTSTTGKKVIATARLNSSSGAIIAQLKMDAPQIYDNSMSITRCIAGRDAQGRDSYYGTLWYWDDDDRSYQRAYAGSCYWYRSSTSESGTTTVHY